ncbi:MAG: caspase family protein, partial [Ferruginibacter sp.]
MFETPIDAMKDSTYLLSYYSFSIKTYILKQRFGMAGTKKFLILLLCSFSFAAGTHAQVQALDARPGMALVVGISQYQQPAIPALTYADKDAGVFAGWLQSKAGGSLPGYNIKLLTNENATIAAVYSAMDWLKENAKEGDVVYLYFSGHGDVEIDSERISQGYLLCYNSPANNYVNNAVSIEDLNACANALTIKNKAIVVMITDACHTGKLAGDNYKGKQLTAQNLRAVQNFQVRIAACGEDEEAAEGPAWGGGRGAFSYYLLNGLNGQADSIKDNVVRLQELDNFLQASFFADKFLRSQGFSQHPVISGNKLLPMAGIDSATLRSLKAGNEKSTSLPAGLQSLKSVGLQPIDYFFECARDDFFERSLDFSKYINVNADEIPAALVQVYIYYQQNLPETDDKWINDDTRYRIETPAQLAMLNLLAGQLQKNKILITRFNEKFVETVQGKGQEMINAYLQGDIAEIEKRQYFNSGKRIYENFLNEVILARRLVNPGHYLASILEVQQAYLSGLNDRLKMETSLQMDTLFRSAFKHQHEALALSPYAPYIHNEIANLYFIEKKADSAAYHYNMATILAPTWAIPWSNMIRLSLASDSFKNAREAIDKAIALQPNLGYVKLNAGIVLEHEGNFLAAESYYLQAIAQNSVHYLPYERLGKLYIKTGEFVKADYYLYEANKRKESFVINERLFRQGMAMMPKTSFNFRDKDCHLQVKPGSSLEPYKNLMDALDILSMEKIDTAETERLL